MPETERLLALARNRLRAGDLPAQTETTALGGRSAGVPCGLCGRPIESGAPEIEIEWRVDAHLLRVPLHPACHSAWLTVSRQPFTADTA